MVSNAGQLLLILISADAQTAAQLTAASDLSPADTMCALARLLEQGFLVAGVPQGEVAVYRLNPQAVGWEGEAPWRCILLVEADVVVQDLITQVLEAERDALSVARAPTDAQTLLREVAFDLLITDGVRNVPNAVLVTSTALLTVAGATPVALFTAHRLALSPDHTAGFRDMLAQPFELDTLHRQVHALLSAPAR